MKHKLITAGVVVAILAGITAFNAYYELSPVMTEQDRHRMELIQRVREQRESLGNLPRTVGENRTEEDEAAVNEFTRAAEDVEGPAADFPTAPDVYRVLMETSQGDVLIEVNTAWAPLGAQRFHDLVTAGYYDGVRFFRVVPGFVVQWGIHGEPAVNTKWNNAHLRDDPVVQGNEEGYLSFAAAGPNTRTTQVFINLTDNRNLDGMGFAAFGRVVEGLDAVREFNSEYGEAAGQHQGEMQRQGNTFFAGHLPGLDYIKRATIVEE